MGEEEFRGLSTVLQEEEVRGAILVFLPGVGEIRDAVDAMLADPLLSDPARVLIIPLHAELSTQEQRMVFCRPPAGVTKVVVSTNVAEASITIDDVTAVVDCGAYRSTTVCLTPVYPHCVSTPIVSPAASGGNDGAGLLQYIYCTSTY
jgi:ATP-dependent RNA helicase DHX36